MIENVVILLLSNIFIPMLPLSPLILLPVPLIQFPIEESSVFHKMQLPRIHTDIDFRNTFRQSSRKHHPDRGGSKQTFNQIRNLKKIMEQPINYYDILNVTDVDLAYNDPLQTIVQIKQMRYYLEFGLYYFIALLFGIAFTIDEQLRPARKILLPLTLATLVYELSTHWYPHTTTLIDLIDNKMPLFVQGKILRRTLALLIALIRSYYAKMPSEEKKLLQTLGQQNTLQVHCVTLQGLNEVYKKKCEQKEKDDKSLLNKIRKRISQGISWLIIIMIIKSFIPNWR